MKNLGRISADIYHRHFANDSFSNIRGLDEFTNLKVVTYVSVNDTYNSILSNFKYIFNEFLSKSKSSQVIIGLKNISNHRLDDYILKLQEHIKSLDSDIVVYLHSRCHIKLISSDEVTILGSQNVAGTSNSFIENARRNFDNVYNDHELIVELKEDQGLIGSNVFNEIVSDSFSCCRLLNQPSSFYVQKLREGYNYQTILSVTKILKDVSEVISTIEYEFFKNVIEINDIDPLVLFEHLETLSDGYMNDEERNNNLAELSLHLYGDDGIFNNEEVSTGEILESVSLVHEIIDECELGDLHESITGKLNRVEELLEFDEFLNLNRFGSEVLEKLYQDIKSEIDDMDFNNLDEFLESNFDEIVHRLSCDPSDIETHDIIDNDGNIEEHLLRKKLARGDISNGAQIGALLPEIEDMYEILANIISDYFNSHIEMSLSAAIDTLDEIMDIVKGYIERFQAV